MVSNVSNRTGFTVKFFPIWFAATFSIISDMIAFMLDEVIMGQLFDDSSFAAINLTEPIAGIRFFISYMICVGGAALILRAHGDGNKNRMSDIFSMSVILSILSGVIMTLILVIFDKQIIYFLSGGGELYDLVYECFTYDKLIPLIDIIYTFLYVFVLYFGGNIHAIIATFVSVSTNALFSVYFGGAIGIAGIRLGTLFSLICSTLILLTFFINKDKRLKLNEHKRFYRYLYLGYTREHYIYSIGNIGSRNQFICSVILWCK